MKTPLIKPSHRGLLHEKLGVPQGEPIPLAKKEAAAHSSDPTLRKEGQFALNFGKKKSSRAQQLRDYLRSPTL
jgi:hypothetical protein